MCYRISSYLIIPSPELPILLVWWIYWEGFSEAIAGITYQRVWMDFIMIEHTSFSNYLINDSKCVDPSLCAILPIQMPSQSKVKQYKTTRSISPLSDKSFEVFGKRPFRWQLEAAQAILCGRDVVLDIGTGSGKTLCFTLPLLLNNSDIALTGSPPHGTYDWPGMLILYSSIQFARFWGVANE